MNFQNLKIRLLRKISILTNKLWIFRVIRRFQGLNIASDVTMDIQGSFSHGNKVYIGKGTTIVVHRSGALELGDACYIGNNVEISPDSKIIIGNKSSIQHRSTILGDVEIGKYCLFSYNVYISSGQHNFDVAPHVNIKDQDFMAMQNSENSGLHNKVYIGDDCWVGTNVVIMRGITIGKGAIIGANTLVTRDVEPYTILSGSPGKVIARRLNFIPPKKISYLIEEELPYFYSGFSTSLSEMESDGIRADRKFTIFMDTSGAKSVHLRFKPLKINGVNLCLNGTYNANLPCNVGQISYKLDRSIDNKLTFSLSSDQPFGSFLLQEVWVG